MKRTQTKARSTEQLTLIQQKKTTFTLPQDLYRRLKIESAKQDKEMSAIVVEALREYLPEKSQ